MSKRIRIWHGPAWCLVLCFAAAVLLLGAAAARQAAADVGYLGDGSLVAWGSNSFGQCNVPSGDDFIAVGAGGSHCLAVCRDGSLAAWGRNAEGQCNVPSGDDFIDVAAGYLHSLAVRSDGSLVAFGLNSSGQCNVPGGTYQGIAADGYHNVALASDGSLAAWGRNGEGQCNVPSEDDFIDVAAGSLHSLAVRSDGSCVGWGHSSYGRYDLPSGSYLAVAGGYEHSVGVLADGTAVSCGRDNAGSTTVPSGDGFVDVDAGDKHNLFLRADGSLAATGSDYEGETSDTPTSGWFIDFDCGNRHSVALMAQSNFDELVIVDTVSNDRLLQRDVSANTVIFHDQIEGRNNATLSVAVSATVGAGGVVKTDDQSWTLDCPRLILASGGTLTADTTCVVPGGMAVVLQGGSITASGGISVSNAALLEAEGTVSAPVISDIGGTVKAVGDLVLGNPASFNSFACDGLLDVGPWDLTLQGKGFVNLGLLTTLDGGELNAAGGVALGVGDNLTGSGVVDAKIAAGFGSTIEAGGPLALGDPGALDGFISDGVLKVESYAVSVNDANEAVLGSLTTLDGGSLTAANADPADTHAHFLVEQGKNVSGNGTIDGNFKSHGHVVGDGDAAGGRIVFSSGWTVSGKGDFVNCQFDGTYAPGDSPAVVDVTNALFAGTVEVELGGPLPGFDSDAYDQINDSGLLAIGPDAVLELLSYDDYEPAIGDEFEILTWQSGRSGEFADVVADPWFTDRGVEFELSYGDAGMPGALTLFVVPEPSTLVLLCLGAAGLLPYGRRRRRRG